MHLLKQFLVLFQDIFMKFNHEDPCTAQNPSKHFPPQTTVLNFITFLYSKQSYELCISNLSCMFSYTLECEQLTGCKEKLSSPCQPLRYPNSHYQVLRKLKQKGPPSISKHNQQLKKTELKPLKKNDTPNPVTVWAIQKNQLHCWQNCKTKHTGWIKHLLKVMNTWTVYIIQPEWQYNSNWKK